MKWRLLPSTHSAFAGMAVNATSKPSASFFKSVIPPTSSLSFRILVRLAVSSSLATAYFRSAFSEEAIRVHVHCNANLGAPLDARQPGADDVLDVETALGMDQEALAVAAAQHGERGGGGAEHGHAFDLRGGAAD